ncbi:uroporphyrinogen-III synthase [Arthrobacter sp. CAN_A1]|uniref:uroporphyrinogen-III synthase n=1 Tax=Arthrobacter sp. CAN_A1 TaxID=2787717 RepID=UPI0018CA4D4F
MTPDPIPRPLPLAGVRVVLLRSVDRSGPMVRELRSRGADVLLLPLIDFVTPEDGGPLDTALDLLSDGGFAWLLVTSSTTVSALKQRSEARGGALAGALHPGTRIAAVGDATAGALAAEGIRVDLVPERAGEGRSAAGLAAAFARLTPDGRILLPQTDLAAGTLERTLVGQGWDVLRVTAYQTVTHPADPARRITAGSAPDRSGVGPLGSGHAGATTGTELDREGFWAAAGAGAVDAVVFTSPSTVRQLSDGSPAPWQGTLPGGLAAVMIGAATADEAAKYGIRGGTVAVEPTPVGIADAIAAAVRDHPRS